MLYRIVVADFNKDGIDDIFSVSTFLIQKGVDAEEIKKLAYPHALLLSTPEGKFRDASSDIEGNTGAPCNPDTSACTLWTGHNAAGGDINGDGYPDLSIGHKLFLNENGEKFVDVTDQLPSEWEDTNIYQGPMSAEIKDFNNDGFGDLVMFWFDKRHLDDPPDPEILLSNGTANISEWTRHYLPIGYFGDGLTKFNDRFSGDIDGDGDLDMVTSTTRTNPYYYRGRFIQVLINDGNGNFTDNSFEALGEQPRAGDYADPDYTHFCNAHGEGSIFLRDYDGDGDLDIIDVADDGGDNTCAAPSIFLNNGTGVFSELAVDLAWVQHSQVAGWETYLPPNVCSGCLRPPWGTRMIKAYPLNLDNKNKLDFVSQWQAPSQVSDVPVENIRNIYQVMSVGDKADTDDDGVPNVYISGGNRTIADTDGVAGESVSFTGTATDSDGTIATTQWLVGGSVVATSVGKITTTQWLVGDSAVATGLTPTLALSNGATVITFKATDNDGNSSTTTVTVTVAIPTYTVTDEWLSPYNGVTPDSSLGLAFNNIGVFSASDSMIYTCLRIFTDGLPGSAGGISEFDIGLTVVSLDEATVQITKYREFNTIGALNENAELPDCSGKFETTTGIYFDFIEAGDSVLWTVWLLIDPANLILKLIDYQELTAN